MATQKAYRLHGYGGRENIKLDDVEVPTLNAGQVLVEVRYTAVNPFDWKIREGYVRDQMPLPLPYTLGVDVVGTVKDLGEGATRFQVGDRVMTMSNTLGAFAEHIALDEAVLARIPDGLSDADAATVPIPVMTAWMALHQAEGDLAGKKVLINGASGVVGAFATQYAKQAGAYVVGVASGKNRDFVIRLGADEFIDYTSEHFEERVGDIDLALDFVLTTADSDSVDRYWKVMKNGGALVSVTDPSIKDKAPEGYQAFFPFVRPDPAVLQEAGRQLVEGALTTKVARVFGREELLDAIDLNQQGGTAGRLVVDFRRT